MKLYFIRHGTTGLIEETQKAKDPLSAEGIEQISRLAQRLKPRTEGITSVFSSDLDRAFQTAEILVNEMGFKGEHQVKKELREVPLWLSPHDLHEEQKYSESIKLLEETQTAVLSLVNNLSHKKDDVHILVAHGNLIRATLGALIKMDIESIVRLSISNASLSIVEYDEKEDYYRLVLFNDTSHLE